METYSIGRKPNGLALNIVLLVIPSLLLSLYLLLCLLSYLLSGYFPETDSFIVLLLGAWSIAALYRLVFSRFPRATVCGDSIVYRKSFRKKDQITCSIHDITCRYEGNLRRNNRLIRVVQYDLTDETSLLFPKDMTNLDRLDAAVRAHLEAMNRPEEATEELFKEILEKTPPAHFSDPSSAEAYLKSQIGIPAHARIIACGLLLAGLVVSLLPLLSRPRAKDFYQMDSASQYVRVLAVEQYQTTATYGDVAFTLISDSENYLYLLSLSEPTRARLLPSAKRISVESEWLRYPEPILLEGTSRRIPIDAFPLLTEQFKYALSDADAVFYIGNCYLAEGDSGTLFERIYAMRLSVLIGIVLIGLGAASILAHRKQNHAFRSGLERLRALKLVVSAADALFESGGMPPVTVSERILLRDFLFFRAGHIFPLQSLLWVYLQPKSRNRAALILSTANEREISVQTFPCNDTTVDKFRTYFQSSAPHVLFGDTPENRAAYERLSAEKAI